LRSKDLFGLQIAIFQILKTVRPRPQKMVLRPKTGLKHYITG